VIVLAIKMRILKGSFDFDHDDDDDMTIPLLDLVVPCPYYIQIAKFLMAQYDK
jgi:hypothetical protein